MANPYQSPASQPADAEAPKRTKRIWVLQALAALKLFGGLYGIVVAFGSSPGGVSLGFAVQLALGVVTALAFILALQRVFPRAHFVAPAAGLAFWANGVSVTLINNWRRHEGALLSAPAPKAADVIAGVVAHGALLALVVSLMMSERTQDYLRGARRGK